MMFSTMAFTVWFAACIDVARCFVGTIPYRPPHMRAFPFGTTLPKNSKDSRSYTDPSHQDEIKPVRYSPSQHQSAHFEEDTVDEVPCHPPMTKPFGTVIPKNLMTATLVPLDFESDIKALIDIEAPYYALKNEHSIVDEVTEERVGFVCTVRREMPVAREHGGVAFGEVGRHMGATASVASALMNPMKGRFHYLASDYSCVVSPLKGIVAQELHNANADASVLGAFNSDDPDELTIYCRCNSITKKESHCEMYLETKDTTWHAQMKLHLISDKLFARKRYSTFEDEEPHSCNPYHEENSNGSCIHSIKQYPEVIYDWIALDGKLRTWTNKDCVGHFYNGSSRCVPHSSMLLHNFDLVGQAISSLTGCNIPYKTSRTKIQPGDFAIKMDKFEAQPQSLHFPNSHELKLQVKAYLNEGVMGEPGSKYRAECLVQEEDTICYSGLGTFVLDLAE